MKKKDLIALWEEEGDLKRMQLFFQKNSASLDQKNRIKQLTLDKIQVEEEVEEERIARKNFSPKEPPIPEWSKENLPIRISRFFKSLWWRWQWKLAFPLIVLFLLIGAREASLHSPLGSSGQKSTASQATSQSASVPSPASTNSTKDAAPILQNSTTYGMAAGSPPPNSGERNSGGTTNAPKVKSPAIVGTPQPGTPSEVPPADEGLSRKITYNVNLSLQVEDVNQTMTRLTQTIKTMGGYVAESHQDGTSHNASAHLTLKVPAGQLDELRALLPELGKILSQQTTANDITNQYYDAETRLRSWEAQEQRYLEILKEAKNVDDILKVENALANIRLQLEQLKGQLKLWDHEVDYSTVQFNLQTTPSPVNIDDPWHPIAWEKTWQSIKDAVLKTISSSWNALSYLIVGIAYALPYLGLGFLFYLVFRILRSKRGK